MAKRKPATKPMRETKITPNTWISGTVLLGVCGLVWQTRGFKADVETQIRDTNTKIDANDVAMVTKLDNQAEELKQVSVGLKALRQDMGEWIETMKAMNESTPIPPFPEAPPEE